MGVAQWRSGAAISESGPKSESGGCFGNRCAKCASVPPKKFLREILREFVPKIGTRYGVKVSI